MASTLKLVQIPSFYFLLLWEKKRSYKMDKVLHTRTPWEQWWVMLLESLTVPKLYHDSSEFSQRETSGTQRHLASCCPHTSSSLHLILPTGFTLVPLNSLELEVKKGCTESGPSPPLPSGHTSPVHYSRAETTWQLWDHQQPKEENRVQFCSTHPPSYTPSPPALQSWGAPQLWGGIGRGGHLEQRLSRVRCCEQEWRSKKGQDVYPALQIPWYYGSTWVLACNTHTALCYYSIHHSVWEVTHYWQNTGALLTYAWWTSCPKFPML